LVADGYSMYPVQKGAALRIYETGVFAAAAAWTARSRSAFGSGAAKSHGR
jgi:hypothetical protein